MGDSPHVLLIKRFYDVSDGRQAGDRREFFADDVQIHAPKFGIGLGIAGLEQGGAGRRMFHRLVHHVDTFIVTETSNRVVVEGTTEGETVSGRSWNGELPGSITGRFCTVFDSKDGKICRMFAYFDPDLADEDAARYPWPRRNSAEVHPRTT